MANFARVPNVAAVTVDHHGIGLGTLRVFRAEYRGVGLGIGFEVANAVRVALYLAQDRRMSRQFVQKRAVGIARLGERINVLLGGVNTHFAEVGAARTHHIGRADMVDDLMAAFRHALQKPVEP